MRRMIRSVCALFFAIHHAKSSKGSESNSKLLKRVLEGNSFLAALGPEEALFHLRVSQKIRCFAFGLNLAPQLDRHNNADRLAARVRDVLDFAFRHCL